MVCFVFGAVYRLDCLISCRKLEEVHCTFFTSIAAIRQFLVYSRSRENLTTFLVFGKYDCEGDAIENHTVKVYFSPICT